MDRNHIISLFVKAIDGSTAVFNKIGSAVDDLARKTEDSGNKITKALDPPSKQADKLAESIKGVDKALASPALAGGPLADLAQRFGGLQSKTAQHLADLQQIKEKSEAAFFGASAGLDAVFAKAGKVFEFLATPLGRVIVGVTAGFVALGAAAFAAMSKVEEAMAAAYESTARLDALFTVTEDNAGVTRQEISVLGSTLARTMGIASSRTNEAAAALTSFFSVSGDNFTRTLTVAADIARAKGRDIVAVTEMLGRALQKPGENLTYLRRVGVVVSSAAQEEAKALQAIGKTAEAQKVILDDLATHFDGVGEKMGRTIEGARTRINLAIGGMFEGTAAGQRRLAESWAGLADVVADPELIENAQLVADTFAQMKASAIDAEAGIIRAMSTMALTVVGWFKWMQDELKKRNIATNPFGLAKQAALLPFELVGFKFSGAPGAAASQGPQGPRPARGSPGSLTLGEQEAAAQYRERELARGKEVAAIMLDLERKSTDERAKIEASYRAQVDKINAATVGDYATRQALIVVAAKNRDDALAKIDANAAKRNDAAARAAERVAAAAEAAALRVRKALADPAEKIAIAYEEAVMNANMAFGITAKSPPGQLSPEQAKAYYDEQLLIAKEYLKNLEELYDKEQKTVLSIIGSVSDPFEDLNLSLASTLKEIDSISSAVLDRMGVTRDGLREMAIGDYIINREKLIEDLSKVRGEVSEFAIEAARNVQDAFADAFYNMGKGWEGTLRGFFNAFRRLLANFAASKLMEAIGLDKLISGKKGEGLLDKIFETIFPAKSKVSKSGGGASSPSAGGTATRADPVPVEVVNDRVDTGVDSRDRGPVPVVAEAGDALHVLVMNTDPIPVMVMNWPGEGVDGTQMPATDPCRCMEEIIGPAMERADQATAKVIEESMMEATNDQMGALQKILGGFKAAFDKLMKGLGTMMNAVLSGIQKITKKAGGGGTDYGQIAGQLAQAYFSSGSGFAGGGQIRGYRAGGGAVVGEEGPELFMPGMSGTIFNNRQLAFVGAGRAGGVTYSPTYNVTFSGGKDDRKMMEDFKTYIDRKDKETEGRIHNTLRRNGMGRMRK